MDNGNTHQWPLAVMSALRFRDASPDALRQLAKDDWKSLLNVTDAAHLTLPLGIRCRELFPAEAQSVLDRVIERNGACYERLLAQYKELADAFEQNHVEFVVLKGLAQWPCYTDDPRDRYHSDIDVYCPPASLDKARQVLVDLAYEPFHPERGAPTDHLPVMIRKTGWTWSGDYYDASRPLPVEVHFRFWDPSTEGFGSVDPHRFWFRRECRDIGGVRVPALNSIDTLRYSAMHLMRHLLRGDLQIRHVYEVAHFLHRSALDESFWRQWAAESSGKVGLFEAIAFRLAAEWFGCDVHPAALATYAHLPLAVEKWFHLFSLSPALASVKPNKDELWLHLALVQDVRIRRRIVLRRVFPFRRERVVLDAHISNEKTGLVLRARRIAYEARFLARRVVHHFKTFAPLLRSGLRWHRSAASLQ